MAVQAITLRSIAALQAGVTLWDTKVRGFGVRRQRRAAVYVLKYRYQGQQRFITIGTHGSPWPPEEARAEARRLLGIVASKESPRDPAAHPHKGPAQTTFAAFAERYLEEYATARKKPRTVMEDRRNLALHILPALGDLDLTKISRAEVAKFHTGRRAHPVNANRCLALVSHIFSVAETWGLRDIGSNPCRGVERFRERRRERFLNGEEIGRLGAVLARASQGYSEVDYNRLEARKLKPRLRAEDWRAIACFELLLYTGARLSEILSLEWSWIDWDRGCARLPDSKTGSKTVPLPSPALLLLRGIYEKALRTSTLGLYVLPGEGKGRYFATVQPPWRRIRFLAGLDNLRLHDLRHAYASTAVAAGESLYLVGSILGHHQSSTTQRYAHLSLDPVLEVANRTAGRIEALLNRKPGSHFDPNESIRSRTD